jgi:signal transduction histidine kinase
MFGPGPPRQEFLGGGPQMNDGPGQGPRPRLPDQARGDIRRPAPFDADGRPMMQNDDRILDAESFKNKRLTEPVFKTVIYNGVQTRVVTNPMWREGELRGFVQVGYELDDFNRLRTTQLTVSLVLIPFVLLTSGFFGAFLAGRALRPVRQVADAAERMTTENLETRLPVAGNDELGRLSASFNSMLGRLHGSFEERSALIRQLESSLERQRRFVADASHELRTPLARLRLVTSSALTQDSTESELKRALELADQAGISMTSLIEQLLALARLEGKLEEHEVSSLLEVVSEATAPYGSRIKVQEAPNVWIKGRQPDLIRAITNLIDNSIRHTPPENEIQIVCSNKGEFCEIVVADKGQGIAAEHLPKLGERFYRVDEARNRKDGGSGLGLSIVKSILEQSGGSMTVQSQVGIGTRITLRLPVSS